MLACESMTAIFPAIRARLSHELVYNYKLSQSTVAAYLGISQPAVSQYLRQIRGRNSPIFNNDAVSKEISFLTKKIFDQKGNIEMSNEFCNICRVIRQEGLLDKFKCL